MAKLERVRLSGTPYERGVTHGERFADEIASNVEIYLDRFGYHGVDTETAREQAEEFIRLIESENEAYAEEMRGIADGGDVPLVDVTMLNVRWEVIYTAWKEETESDADGSEAAERSLEPEVPVDGCTSYGVLPLASADGATYMGQNWDWISSIADNLFLMELRRDDGPDMVTMTEAGIVGGKCGVNEHGIGIAVNGLISPDDGKNPFRKPFHVRFREILDADTFDDALRPIVETDRACSSNIMVGHADGEVFDFETAPEQFNVLQPDETGILTHSNHFETDAIESLNEKRGPNTLYRAPRLRRRLIERAGENGIDTDGITDALRDHFGRPASICRHVDETLPEQEHVQTNASFVINLTERRLLATQGPPCEDDYHEYRLAT